MPLINKYSNDYDPGQGLAQGIGSIGQALAMAPRIRAQGALMRAQTGEAAARGSEASAHADLYKQLGLKSKDEMDAAQSIAEEFKSGGVTTNQDGSLTIAPASLGRIAGLLARTGKGANDIGGGVSKLFGTANAPVEANANRVNKIDVARVKPIILNPNQTAVANDGNPTDNNPSASDVDNPQQPTGIGRVLAIAPPGPTKALPDYTTTTISDIKNPAYDAAQGMTNAPPMIKRTNTVSRVSGATAKVQPTAQPQAAPSLQQRQANQVYYTPKGPMKWTGTGWTQP